MVYHVVLLKARDGLSNADRLAFVEAFRRAAAIEVVKGVRLGARVRHGAGYEDRMPPDTADILAILEFEDLVGLQAYLRHPAHQELGARFSQSIESALVYDFEVGGIERLDGLAGSPG
jgi:hypothetical protein